MLHASATGERLGLGLGLGLGRGLVPRPQTNKARRRTHAAQGPKETEMMEKEMPRRSLSLPLPRLL
jgi:hypothetical protein